MSQRGIVSTIARYPMQYSYIIIWPMLFFSLYNVVHFTHHLISLHDVAAADSGYAADLYRMIVF